MTETVFDRMRNAITQIEVKHPVGRVTGVWGGTIQFRSTGGKLHVGDKACVHTKTGDAVGKVIRIALDEGSILLENAGEGIAVNDRITLHAPRGFAPDLHWIGRVIDPEGTPLDGRPLLPGSRNVTISASPPPPHQRRGLGDRLETGLAVFNTLLPLVRGQRIGLFAGSGVGKSTLIADLALGVSADVIVIALVGERGREVRQFVEDVLGEEGMKKVVVVAATSDHAPQMRRRCALSATAVAEAFRDKGLHVLLLVDSMTRFCEAHREIAVAQGEAADLRGFPASTAAAIASLCERSGPGVDQSGDITAVFSVLVAGSDMDEPVADMLRGVLDGHITLDREIAERGRFPAIDVVRSVSRALPEAATDQENQMIARARQLLASYQRAELMIQSGLYEAGSDPQVDAAIASYQSLDKFLTIKDQRGSLAHFAKLRQAMVSGPMQSDAPQHPPIG